MTARFRRRLAELKRNGCNVLLVGTDGLDAACERLLGESSAGPRYRLFVTADAGPPTALDRLAAVQSGPYADAATVVNWGTDVRGTGAADGSDARRAPDGHGQSFANGQPCAHEVDPESVRQGDATVRIASAEGEDLGELLAGVEDAVASFEDDAGDLSPAELRLCFDSLTPLATDYDDRAVERFLADLTDAVERVDGMGHYHVSGAYADEAVSWLEPLFDAVVEVRRVDGRVEQRWHVSDSDLITGWLPL